MPLQVITKLNALINEGLRGAGVAVALAMLYALTKIGATAEFEAFLVAEVPKWTGAVKISGAKID